MTSAALWEYARRVRSPAADAMLGRYARRRVRVLDRRPAADVQRATLLRLVRHARLTRFGRDHDFDAVRTVADYQQRVPLRDYEAFWKTYWQAAFPAWTTSPGPARIPYLRPLVGHNQRHDEVHAHFARDARLEPPRRADDAGSVSRRPSRHAAVPRPGLFSGRQHGSRQALGGRRARRRPERHRRTRSGRRPCGRTRSRR